MKSKLTEKNILFFDQAVQKFYQKLLLPFDISLYNFFDLHVQELDFDDILIKMVALGHVCNLFFMINLF